MGYADALLGGATYSTADTVRPALQIVKTKKGANLVSSCFIMVRGDEKIAMGDCAINLGILNMRHLSTSIIRAILRRQMAFTMELLMHLAVL